jgi:hypothetical protein
MVLNTGMSISGLTTIFLGLLVLATGLYLQAKPTAEGFQATGGASAPPAAAIATAVSPPSIAGATLNSSAPEGEDLKRKVAEMRTIMAAVTTNKPKQDLTLNGLLDSETMNTLNTLVEEVTFFDSKPPSPELELFLTHLNQFEELSDTQKGIIRNMIMVGYQEASVLYYIYITLPAMIISTGVVVDGNTAISEDLVKPAVAKELKSTIMSILSGVPRLSTKLEEASKSLFTLMADFKDIQRANPDYLDRLNSAFNDYFRLANIKVQSYKRQISLQKATAQAKFSADTVTTNGFLQKAGQNITATIQGCIDFIQLFLDTVQPIQMQVDDAMKEYAQLPALSLLKNSIDTAMQTMALTKTSITYAGKVEAIPSATAKEGFASGGNPYGAPTPNLYQALKFRLGKDTLVTEVNASSLL